MTYKEKISSRMHTIRSLQKKSNTEDLYIDIEQPDEYEDILLLNNIKPLRYPGERTSMIGSGKESVIYRVLYNGKQAIARMPIYTHEKNNHLRLHKTLDSIINKEDDPVMRGKINNVFPRIYKLIPEAITGMEYTDEYGRQYKETTEIVISELLIPMAKESEEYMDAKKTPRNIESFMLSLYNEIIDYMTKNNFLKEGPSDIKDILINNEQNIIKDFAREVMKHIYDKRELDISAYTKNMLQRYFDKDNPNNDGYSKAVEFLSKTFADNFDRIKNRKSVSFPYYPGDTREIQWRQQEETVEIFNVLDHLSDKYDYNYSDLSSENIMMRPGTNELVISDLGNFEHKNNRFAKIKEPIKSNNDYQLNFVDRIKARKKRMQKRRRNKQTLKELKINNKQR